MSTRWYPLYQKGSPQLRVYLPNFWLKIVRPAYKQPPNIVQFACSMEMTTFDVKNYLEKIYGINIVDVRTRIALGKTRHDQVKGYVVKDDDIKYAYVTLPKNEKFEFPNLFPDKTKEEEDDKKNLELLKKNYVTFEDRNKNRPGVPGWFTV